jgi:hypothetical protein
MSQVETFYYCQSHFEAVQMLFSFFWEIRPALESTAGGVVCVRPVVIT